MSNGPWVQVAALCERVDPGPPLQLSTLVDKIHVQGPEGRRVVVGGLTLVVCLWADDLPAGTYRLKFQPHAPDGAVLDMIETEIEFPESGPSGVNALGAAPFTVDQPGVYWYDVLFTDADGTTRMLSRFPLTVNWNDSAT